MSNNSNSNSNSGYNANNDEEGKAAPERSVVQPKSNDTIIDSLNVDVLLLHPLNSNSPQTPLVIVWSAMKEKMIKAKEKKSEFGANLVPMILEGEILRLGLRRTPKIKLLLMMYWVVFSSRCGES